MRETSRTATPTVSIPVEGIVAAVTAGAFLWLLAQGAIQPIAVYLLELYLSF